MKLFKNIYTFLVGENKDVSELGNYPNDNIATFNNLFVYDEFSFDKEYEFEEETEEENEKKEESEEESEEREDKNYQEEEDNNIYTEEEVETKKYWLYSEEYKDEFIEEFVLELKQRALL